MNGVRNVAETALSVGVRRLVHCSSVHTYDLEVGERRLPRQVLSDNGLCFTERLHSTEVVFETSLADLSVEMVNSGNVNA